MDAGTKAILDEMAAGFNFNQTSVHPLALLLLGVCVLSVFVHPRRTIPFVLLLLGVVISEAQRIAILGLDFTLLRLLILAALVRLIARGEISKIQRHPMDIVFAVWILVSTTAYNLLHGSVAALVYTLGEAYSMIGLYTICRSSVRNLDDVRSIISWMAWLALPIAVAFVRESITRHNIFSLFGGVPEITVMREGKLRCQGAFSHPIMAGCFWVALVPLYSAAWICGGIRRTEAIFATLCAMIIAFTSSSSTPMLGLVAGMLAAAIYPLRSQIKWIVISGFAGLAFLHMIMKSPVWSLLGRVDLVGGSTGWHRYALFDAFVNRVNEWFLIGVVSTAHWGEGLFDVTNQFILEAVRGGFGGLALFIILVYLAFRASFQRLRLTETAPADRWLVWALISSLFMHCVMFFGVSYFGQVTTLWYLQLAIAASLAPGTNQPPEATSTAPLPVQQNTTDPWFTGTKIGRKQGV